MTWRVFCNQLLILASLYRHEQSLLVALVGVISDPTVASGVIIIAI